ncbi:MAG: hypothetical protein H6835_04620 [Planctomycetes bacterium]|nr:hypothetical protein [Planctomycetota bacterium]
MMTFRDAFLSLATLALCATANAQGNAVTIGIQPGQSTTGTASDGSPGGIGITIGGFGNTPVVVPPGTDSMGIATAATAALAAQGFTVVQNGTDVIVTAGPGGAPLQSGGGIGSTDTGINGVKAKVTPPAGPGGPGGGPGGGGPGPNAGKQNGGQVQKANPQKFANSSGSIQVDVEVLKFVNGTWTLLWIQVVVPVFAGDTGQAVNDRVRQQLQGQGLIVSDLTLPPVVAPMTSGSFGMDRTQDGGRVQGVGFAAGGGARDVLDGSEAGAGQVPQQGATEYDRSIDENGDATTDWFRFAGDATVGGGGVLDAHVLPGQFGLWAITPGPGGLGLGAPLIPAPFLHPGFDLPIDPLAALLLPGISDPLGGMQLPLPIPPDPALGGAELLMTALTIDPFGASLFDGVRRTNGVTLRIGD